jgi:hypothetical protein
VATVPPAGPLNTGSGAIATDGSVAAGAGGAAAAGQNAIAIAGNNGQIVIVQPGDGAGALAEFVSAIRPPARWPRRDPPRRLRSLVGRAEIAQTLDASIAGRAATVLTGLEGAGKTTLLVDVLNGAAASANADGVILLERAPGSPPESADDLAQRIYDAVWDTGTPRRLVDASTAQAALSGIAPVVAIDGADVSSPEREVVARILPRSPIVFVSSAVPLGGGLRTVEVGPLPRADAVRLLADRARTEPTVEPDALDRAAELLGDWPGALATIGDMVGGHRITLGRVIEILATAPVGDATSPASAYRRVVAVLRDTLSAGEQAMLDAVAGLPGVSVREDVAAAVAGVAAAGAPTPAAGPGPGPGPGMPPALQGLLDGGLVWRNSPRLRMDGGLRAAILADTSRDAAGTAMAALAETGGIFSDGATLPEEDAALGVALQKHAIQHGDHATAVQLGRALDPVLMATGAWDAWKAVLDRARTSAEATKDEHDLGWVEHELGVRCLGLGQPREARRHLRRAAAIRRRIGDAAGIERTARTIATLRLVPALLGTTAMAGLTGSQVLAIGAVLTLTVLALPMSMLLFSGEPLRSPTPPPSPQPSVAPSATNVIPPFGAVAQFETGGVLPTGDWTGTVIVRPSGGAGPYTFTYGPEVRTDGGAERFAIEGSRCEAVAVGITVTPADGPGMELSDTYVPAECAGFKPPDRPGSGDPSPGLVAYTNCFSEDFGFGVSLDSQGAQAETWSMELERLERLDGVWRPWRAAFGSTSSIGLDLGCDAEYRWRAASTSADGWQSEWTDWWSLALLPTATPEPIEVSLGFCPTTVTLAWTVPRTDGIKDYRVSLRDLTADDFASFVTSDTELSFDVSCEHEYEWTVSSRDGQDRLSPASKPSRFTVPPAVG